MQPRVKPVETMGGLLSPRRAKKTAALPGGHPCVCSTGFTRGYIPALLRSENQGKCLNLMPMGLRNASTRVRLCEPRVLASQEFPCAAFLSSSYLR